MANGASSVSWLQTMFGALGAIAITAAGMYTVVIVPQNTRIDKLEIGRETDRVRIDSVNVLIQTNDEYKKTIATELKWLRSDLDKVAVQVQRVEDEQKRRANSVASIELVIRRIDRIDQRAEENERRFTPTLVDEVKNLRAELQDLRRRIMVPITTNSKE